MESFYLIIFKSFLLPKFLTNHSRLVFSYTPDRPKPNYVILFSAVISEYRDTDLLERYFRSTKYGAGSHSIRILPQEKEDEFKVITQEPLSQYDDEHLLQYE